MRKLVAGMITVALVLSVGSVSVFAAGAGRRCEIADTKNECVCGFDHENCSFVDENEDGICDNCKLDTNENECHRTECNRTEYHRECETRERVCDKDRSDICTPKRDGSGGGHHGRNRR